MKHDSNIRYISRQVNIGGVLTGANHPVRLQSMTKTNTHNIPATVEQCIKAFDAGADLMRISVPDKKSAECLKTIKNKLTTAGYHQPLVADIHYRAELALEAARIVEKIRINPGNFDTVPAQLTNVDNPEREDSAVFQEGLRDKLKQLIELCKVHGTAIRIGVNAGSVSRQQHHHKHIAEILAEAGIGYLQVFESLGFYQTVVSLKASSPANTAIANFLMIKRMQEERMCYPLHIGVTEAGSGISGRVRSALGIMPLLIDDIGNTLRVSLTESPENEISFARSLVRAAKTVQAGRHPETRHSHKGYTCDSEYNRKPQKKSSSNAYPHGAGNDSFLDALIDRFEKKIRPSHSQDNEPGHDIYSGADNTDDLIADVVRQFVCLDNRQKSRHITISAPGLSNRSMADETARQLMQYAGSKVTETEFVSCPACARARMNMEKLCVRVKEELPGYPTLKIAIMGCMVNGPGEMADAHFGLIAAGKELVHLFRGKVLMKKNIPPAEAIATIRKMASDNISR